MAVVLSKADNLAIAQCHHMHPIAGDIPVGACDSGFPCNSTTTLSPWAMNSRGSNARNRSYSCTPALPRNVPKRGTIGGAR